jgi:hypothetical protein
MVTTSTDGGTVRIGGSLVPRVIGGWICLIGVVGLAGITRTVGFPGCLVVGAVWAAPALWWGWRLMNLGIVAGPNDLVVHNPLRTHRASYGEIVDVRLRRRSPSNGIDAALRSLWNRAVGEVVVSSRTKPIEMQTTESLWSGGRKLSRAGRRTERDVETIRALWLERRDRPRGEGEVVSNG